MWDASLVQLSVNELHETVKRDFSQSTPLTHFHEELPLLHHGLASFTAFLDHSVAHQTAEHAALTVSTAAWSRMQHTAPFSVRSQRDMSEKDLSHAHVFHTSKDNEDLYFRWFLRIKQEQKTGLLLLPIVDTKWVICYVVIMNYWNIQVNSWKGCTNRIFTISILHQGQR